MTKRLEDHPELTAEDVWPWTDIAVTFMDGKTIIYKDCRFLAILGFSNPITVNGTTLEFEAGGVPFTCLGVRQYVLGDQK
jgi:hypothetical protein